MDNLDKNEADLKGNQMKSTVSLGKKKMSSKLLQSKPSLKKFASVSETSYGSDTSFVIKKQSEFDRIAKGPRYQNTYRLDSKAPFKAEEVIRLIKQIVDREASDYPHYDHVLMPKLAQLIAGEVRTTIRHLNYDRYKICVLVMVGEKKLHGFHSAFRALWDSERDGWTSYLFQTRTYFILCNCFGLYHD